MNNKYVNFLDLIKYNMILKSLSILMLLTFIKYHISI